MPRDYKHRARKRKRRTPPSPWVGLFAGLLIGLFVAFLVYIKLQADPGQQVYLDEPAVPAVAASKPDEKHAPADETASLPPPKPRFDFYTVLPEMEVIIPEEEIRQKLKQKPIPAPIVAPQSEAIASKPAQPEPVKPSSGTYYLQVGSFRNGVQAERFRAELALLGLQTNLQKVTINNKDTYHRVRVGPFHSFSELDKTRGILKQQGIESTPIKVRG